MSRVPPELIGLDNVMEDFLAEHRRKNLRVVEAETDELIKSSEEIWEHYMDEMRRQKQIWADAHMRFHFPEQFPALPKKKRFSWAGLLALLAVALVVGWMVYQAVEAF